MTVQRLFSVAVACTALLGAQVQSQDAIRSNDELLQLVERGIATDDTEFRQRVERRAGSFDCGS